MSLMKDGLWGIIDGSETAPAGNDGAYSKFITWKSHAQYDHLGAKSF